MNKKLKSVGIIGTGNWGTTIGFMVSKNVLKKSEIFNKEILIWGISEDFEGRNISELINTEHENKKYLPGIKLEENLKYTNDPNSFSNIDILIVSLPHQFINTIWKFKEILKKDIIVLSVVKGVLEDEMTFSLVSEYINNTLGCTTNVLMGANIASDVAKGISGNVLYKCEGTLGYSKESDKEILFNLLNCDAYKISYTKDIIGVELSGSLKNIIALGYGVTEGLGCSTNTRIAFLRRGFIEMKNFIKMFSSTSSSETLFESCGIADLIVSCISGRNYKYGKAKAEENISEQDFEERIGKQKIQGVGTCNCIYNFLLVKDKLEDYPIFYQIWKIFCDDEECEKIMESF